MISLDPNLSLVTLLHGTKRRMATKSPSVAAPAALLVGLDIGSTTVKAVCVDPAERRIYRAIINAMKAVRSSFIGEFVVIRRVVEPWVRIPPLPPVSRELSAVVC